MRKTKKMIQVQRVQRVKSLVESTKGQVFGCGFFSYMHGKYL